MKQSFELKIKPISLHQYYRLARGRQYITEEGLSFKQKIIDLITEHKPIVCYDKPVKLYVEFGYKDNRRKDLDNACKPLLDALNNVLYQDDSLIFELHTRKFLGQLTDFINIEITPIEIE